MRLRVVQPRLGLAIDARIRLAGRFAVDAMLQRGRVRMRLYAAEGGSIPLVLCEYLCARRTDFRTN